MWLIENLLSYDDFLLSFLKRTPNIQHVISVKILKKIGWERRKETRLHSVKLKNASSSLFFFLCIANGWMYKIIENLMIPSSDV